VLIGCVGGKKIGTLGSWKPEYLPKLTSKTCRVTSPVKNSYNCIGWAATGSEAEWWWPTPLGFWPATGFWPAGVPREETVAAFLQAFGTVGYAQCKDGKLEDGFEKVALYANKMPWGQVVPTHAARQLPNGKWTSKLGPLEDIEHKKPADVNGPIYGGIVHYMKRPTQQIATAAESKSEK
jgi:hypothetical protein